MIHSVTHSGHDGHVSFPHLPERRIARRPASARRRLLLFPIFPVVCSFRGRARPWSRIFLSAPPTRCRRALALSAASNAGGKSLRVLEQGNGTKYPHRESRCPVRQGKRVTLGGVDRPFDVLGPFHIDALCAALRTHGNSSGYSVRTYIGVQPTHIHL